MSKFVFARDPLRPPAGLERPVVAIGNFDGLHRGHRAVIDATINLARKLGRPCALLTFEPHPADFFAPKPHVFRLTPEAEKANESARLGLDGMISFSFDADLAGLSAAAFVDHVLIERLDVAAVVVGYDFHFGAKRGGSPDLLRQMGEAHGFEVEIVRRVAADAAGSLEAVSSTATRAALAEGDVARAAQLLGRPWRICGEVLHGRKVGRTLGFPTANIALPATCRLKQGIYAVRAAVKDQDGRCESVTWSGAASFGSRPTFDDGPPLLEVFLLDFEGDLYGETLCVDFIAFLRGEEKFESIEALVAQMRRDVVRAQKILS